MSRILLLCFMLFVGFAFNASAQRTVTGTVTDDAGEGLPGVNVVIKDTATGTISDYDGKYSLAVEEGAILVFSYVGFENQEVEIGARSVIDISLSGVTELQEVVVTGYQNIDKNRLTGSVASLGTEKISQMPFATVDQALQGNIAGLSITGTSGSPGSTQNIIIRGRSTISAGREPLWVIDGVPVNNGGLEAGTYLSSFSPLAALNPENIESITVLKDPGSIAPYGSRGVNGVIVVTTKKGRSKTEFNFSSTFGWQNDATEGPEMLNAHEQWELYLDAISNTYGETFGFDRTGAEAWYLADGEATFGDGWEDWDAAGRPTHDWVEILTNENAPMSTYNFSAQSGNENMNYFASIGYHDQEGTTIGSAFNRWTGSLNLTANLSDKITFSTSNSGAYMEQNGILEYSAYFSGPRSARFFQSPKEAPYNDDGTPNFGISGVYNPLWVTENDINLSRVTRILSNNSIRIELPIENLFFKTTVAVDHQNNNYKEYFNRTHGDGASNGGEAAVEINSTTSIVYQNGLDYTFSVGSDHNISAKFIQEYQESRSINVYTEGNTFAADGLTNVSSAGTITDGSSEFDDYKVAGYLALLNYDFRGKYLFNASFRRDGNSRFAPEARWGNFYSAGAGWNLHEEGFLQGLSFFNALKLRASYGLTGNANIDINEYQPALGFDADYDGGAAVYPSTFGSAGLEWEKAKSFEVGLDYTILNNKISGSVSYYKRNTFDAHQDVPLSRTSGFANVTQNIGELTNSGIEVELNANIVNTEDLSITIGGNLGTNNNEVTKLALDPNGEEIFITTGTRRVASGHIIYEWYMPSYAGVDPENGDALWYTDETKSATTNSFGEAERMFQGKGATPTILAGLNLSISYKGAYVTAQANYAGGHAVLESWTRYLTESDAWSLWFNGYTRMLDRWQQQGDVTTVPRMEYTAKPWRRYDRWLHDGDYIRLRNVTIGYHLPESIINKANLTDVNLFARGVNLWTWVKDKDNIWDPEVEGEGFGEITTPPVKSVTVGLNIKF